MKKVLCVLFVLPMLCLMVSAKNEIHWPYASNEDLYYKIVNFDSLFVWDDTAGEYADPAGVSWADTAIALTEAVAIPNLYLGDMPLEGVLEFDGSTGYVLVGDDDALDFGTGDYSISLWIKLKEFDKHQYIFHKKSSNIGYELQIDSVNQLLISACGSLPCSGAPRGAYITDRDWHHVVAVMDRDGNGTIYTDNVAGTPVDISIDASDDISTTYNLYIGRTAAGTSYFDGFMDDIRIYKKVLSPAEIETIYNSGVRKFYDVGDAGAASVAWNCSERSGTTITDEIASLVGSFNGGTFWGGSSEGFYHILIYSGTVASASSADAFIGSYNFDFNGVKERFSTDLVEAIEDKIQTSETAIRGGTKTLEILYMQGGSHMSSVEFETWNMGYDMTEIMSWIDDARLSIETDTAEIIDTVGSASETGNLVLKNQLNTIEGKVDAIPTKPGKSGGS